MPIPTGLVGLIGSSRKAGMKNQETVILTSNRRGGLRMANCKRCGTYMNPSEAMLGPYCGDCVDKAHRAAVEGRRTPPDLPTTDDVFSWFVSGKTIHYIDRYCVNCDAVSHIKVTKLSEHNVRAECTECGSGMTYWRQGAT